MRVGDVRDPANGKIVAGARVSAGSMEFADSARVMKASGAGGFSRDEHDAGGGGDQRALDKVEANQLAQLAQIGMARAIRPVNTMSDGDLVVALSVGNATRAGGCAGRGGGGGGIGSDSARGAAGADAGRRAGPEAVVQIPEGCVKLEERARSSAG